MVDGCDRVGSTTDIHRVLIPFPPPLFPIPFLPPQTLPVKPIQLHGLVLGTFGSLVAPFGGFLMSAIKRAYGIKDFDSVIPGHGGVTDRMDCQLVMILFTFVHYQTFLRHAPPLGYERVLASVLALRSEDQRRLFEELQKLVGRAAAHAAAATARAAAGGSVVVGGRAE